LKVFGDYKDASSTLRERYYTSKVRLYGLGNYKFLTYADFMAANSIRQKFFS